MISHVHRGQFLQRGKGLGGIFSSLMTYLKPLLSRGASKALTLGKTALKDKGVKDALTEIKKSSLKTGTAVIKRKLEAIEKKQAKKGKQAKQKIITAKKKRHKQNHKLPNNIFT